MRPKYIIGVDEAGRGPLAGPVAVGVVKVPIDFDWKLLPGVGDSKQLSEKKREEVFAAARRAARTGELQYAVGLVSAHVIDTQGIVTAIKRAMHQALTRVDAYRTVNHTIVKLDGGLRASAEFTNQETIIKGDQKELAIGLASVMAKVTRDRYMRRIAKRPAFAPYDFATHKGYGTKAHREAIAQHGLSPQHRVTYCKNIKVL